MFFGLWQFIGAWCRNISIQTLLWSGFRVHTSGCCRAGTAPSSSPAPSMPSCSETQLQPGSQPPQPMEIPVPSLTQLGCETGLRASPTSAPQPGIPGTEPQQLCFAPVSAARSSREPPALLRACGTASGKPRLGKRDRVRHTRKPQELKHNRPSRLYSGPES